LFISALSARFRILMPGLIMDTYCVILRPQSLVN
jgi:hypothetical protein